MIKKMEMKKIAAFMMALAIVSSPMVNADLPQLIPEISVSADTISGATYSFQWSYDTETATFTIAAKESSTSNRLALKTEDIIQI